MECNTLKAIELLSKNSKAEFKTLDGGEEYFLYVNSLNMICCDNKKGESRPIFIDDEWLKEDEKK